MSRPWKSGLHDGPASARAARPGGRRAYRTGFSPAIEAGYLASARDPARQGPRARAYAIAHALDHPILHVCVGAAAHRGDRRSAGSHDYTRLMNNRKALRFAVGFRVAISGRRSQAAEMVLAPGDREGGPGNRHRGSDQWLFVVSGSGRARVAGKPHPLRRHTLLFIARGVAHEIANTGRTPLRTLNIYVPPAYRRDGIELPRGKPR